MPASEHGPVRLADYRAPAWRVVAATLEFDLDIHATQVCARLELRRATPEAAPLQLDGIGLQLRAIRLDGRALAPHEYAVDEDALHIFDAPATAVLETEVTLDPAANSALSGLYLSGSAEHGFLLTQCEAEGFRRITYYPDRPDVLAPFHVTLRADRARFPVLLANGNPAGAGELADGRHWAAWNDPHPKPSYLFAVVAGRLEQIEQAYVTADGRPVTLRIFAEADAIDRCGYAMDALVRAMRWDEREYGRNYDLDVFHIVATHDFNMGAMENKGLNIFNAKYLLADPQRSSDEDYAHVEAIVAHEYFHNWTGNRVTCRDWFQLSLKEGLTVFRDQEFGADVHSRPVTRIQEVRGLRASQFPEDAGPMAHPIRPASYAEINNFYTATVYNKGAEVIRMIHTLLGEDGFQRGMKLYFERHDGQAVTCEDFVAAMADASQVDLTQFRRWYARAGTPVLKASGVYDATAQTYTLTLTQTLAPTAYEKRLLDAGQVVDDGALHIPVAVGLVLPDGRDATLQLAGEIGTSTTRVLSLTQPTQTYVFERVPAAPVVSLLRNFSAPVRLDFEQSDFELAHLMAHDADAFNRWEAGQRLATRVLLAGIAQGGAGTDWIPSTFIDACARVLGDGLAGDAALAAEALALPSETVLADTVAAAGGVIDPDAIFAARLALRRTLAAALRPRFEAAWQALAPTGDYAPDGAQAGRRSLRNTCLAYLADAAPADIAPRLVAQIQSGSNMTDVAAALATLAQLDVPERAPALTAFYDQWHDEALVVDKWLSIQATARTAAAATVRELMRHPAFDLKNPNRVYALIRGFCGANPRAFHAADGAGYALAADVIADLQAMNPQVASRIARSFDRWRQFDASRQAHARAALERIAAVEGLAKDVAEVVGNALKA